MLTHLADVSIRGLLLTTIAAIVLLILRKRSSPALRHAIWTLVVLGMLALFVGGETMPRLQLRVLNPPPSPTATTTTATGSFVPMEQSAPLVTATPAPRRTIDWTTLATDLYALIAAALIIRFLFGMLLVPRLVAQSTPIEDFYESDRIGVPVTAGWLKPVVILPTAWREWDRAKLDAVLTHERAHVRRKDGLFTLLAGLNRCLLWFNPIAWWLEKRIALLAEQACDEASILALGGSGEAREKYIRLLLDMAASITTTQGRLRTHVLAMASPSKIRQRIEPLLRKRKLSRGLTQAAYRALVIACVPILWATSSIDLTHQAAQLHLDVPLFTPPAPPLIAQAQQAPTAPRPPEPEAKFDVASVRPCRDGDVNSGRGRGGGRGMDNSPGLLRISCMTTARLIQIAYVDNGSPLTNDSMAPFEDNRVRGGPSWINSDRYTVEAKTNDSVAMEPNAGPTSAAWKKMNGPMLQQLLEDRFQLKLHRATEQASMYVLTVAKGGLKIKPMVEGECIEGGPPKWPEGGKPPCGWIGWDVHGPNRRLLAGGVSFKFLATALGDMILDQPVADETGVGGNFLFRLEYSPDERTHCMGAAKDCQIDPTSELTPGPSIPDALQDLGLKLTSTKAPHGYIVIDSISRPSEN